MIHRKSHVLIFFRVALLSILAIAASGLTTVNAGLSGYRLHQRVALDVKQSGMSGAVEILEDSRITPALRKAMWGRSYMLDMILGDKDPVRQEFGKRPMLPARLRLVDSAGKVLHDETFATGAGDRGLPLVEIKTVHLYGTSFPTYLVTVDYSTGMGSYNGPVTSFVEIRNSRFDYIRLPDANGKDDRLALMRSLKTDWRILLSQPGKPVVIQSVSCPPDFDNTKSDDFITTYSTYRFDGARWRQSLRQNHILWEADSGWPNARLFP